MMVRTGIVRAVPQSVSRQCAIADSHGYLWNVNSLLDGFTGQLVRVSIEALEGDSNRDEAYESRDYGHDRRTKLICTRVLASTKLQIENMAMKHGLTASEYTRQALLETLQQEQ